MDSPSHDVFISFRGEDTRNGFTSHLHEALCGKGMKVFIDNELKRGEEISGSLIKAIAESRLSIIVFSKHYATSTWCLDELVHIMKYKKSKGQMVRPLFIGVDPSKVRNQTEEYAEALASHEKTDKNRGKMQGWRAALKEAANLSGWHLQNQVESEFIRRIAEEVYNTLNRPILHIAEHPVGLDSRVQAITSMLNVGSNDKCMLLIYGVGGIGKTTIAKAVYSKLADRFEGSCFLMNVGEKSKKYGIFRLQETLLHEVVGEKRLKIQDNCTGRALIKEKLSYKKVFLVLDGVDDRNQLDELAGEKDWFGEGSRIIITARESIPLGRDYVPYEVGELDQVDALRLFSWKAFNKPCPPTDQYRWFSSQLLSSVGGIPLAIIVLGSFLFNKTIKEWIDVGEKLTGMSRANINQVVEMSFDGLEKNEESIFLDIACFFQGHDRDVVTKQWDRCNFHPERGIEKLVNMSLIYIESNKVWMHEIIQEFGKNIVYQESPKDPGKRSRVCCRRDFLQVQNQDSVNNVTEVIKLDWPGAENEFRRNNANKKFKRLRILMVHDIYISGCPGNLDEDLKLLGMHDGSSPRATETSLDANFSGLSDVKDTFKIKSHLGCFQGIIVKDAMGNPVQVLVGSLGSQIAYFQREIKIVSKKAGRKLKQVLVVVGPFASQIISKKVGRKLKQLLVAGGTLGSQINSLHKRCFVMRKKKREHESSWQLHINDAKLCREFSLFEIERATNNFDHNYLIGAGGSGHVYLAKFDSIKEAAVKMSIFDNEYSYRWILNELKIQGHLHHKNILPLLGYFIDDRKGILVMENMSNGTLRGHLDGLGHHTYFLSWSNRIKVALDVARGLEYLHLYAELPIIHRDVKTSNILLNENYTAKLADFGLSIETAEPVYEDAVMGTRGYICPDYLNTNELTTKCDVYGFGIVLLELLTGQKVHFRDDYGNYHTLVDMEDRCKEQIDFLDKRMPSPQEFEIAATTLVRAIARACLTNECKKRPSMTQVAGWLEGTLKICNHHPESRISSPSCATLSSLSSELDFLL